MSGMLLLFKRIVEGYFTIAGKICFARQNTIKVNENYACFLWELQLQENV